MSFYLQYDSSAYKFLCPSTIGQYQPQCVQNKIIADLDYAQTGKNEAGAGTMKPYFSQSNYATFSSKPIFAFFQNDGGISICGLSVRYLGSNSTSPCSLQQGSQYPNCWTAVYDAVRSHLDSILGANNFYMIFYNQGGCSHADADGCYAWVSPHENDAPSNITTQNQQYNDTTTTSAKKHLDDFYYNAIHNTPSLAPNGSPFLIVGSAFKGFDDRDATWGLLRILTQDCGHTWLNSWKEMTWNSNSKQYDPVNGFYTGTHQLQFLIVPTWDDYEEGTETETGISNCAADAFASAIAAPSAQLSWTETFSGTGGADTIDHYTVWATADGNNLIKLADSASSPYTLTSTILGAGTYSVYVQEVSKASLSNHMSSAVSYTPSVLTISPTSYTFSQSGSETFIVTNTGQYTVTISSVTASPSSSFSASSVCNGAVLGANQTCSFNVTGTVPGSGQINGNVTVQHNGANGRTIATLTAGSGGGGGGGCPANTVCNIDDMNGWEQTAGSSTSSLHQNVISPSQDGASAQFSFGETVAYSRAKWENQLGANDSASHFQLDVWADVDEPSKVQGIDFGFSQMYSGSDYAFHFDCNLKGSPVWQVWDSANNAWSATTIPCTTSTFPANTWVHLVFDAQRTTGGQLQYNWLSVNGTQYNINQTFNPNVEGPDNVEVSMTLFGDVNADPFNVWIDEMNLSELPQ